MRESNSTYEERLRAFHQLSATAATHQLRDLCASSTWAAAVARHRPYDDVAALLDASDAAFAALTEADLAEALAGHPRIGDRVRGDGTTAAMSRSEQASMTHADSEVADAIRRGNLEYERKFDRVFLIRAAGRGPREMLGELHRRLGNDPDTEIAEVREQLRQITRLRLEGAFTP